MLVQVNTPANGGNMKYLIIVLALSLAGCGDPGAPTPANWNRAAETHTCTPEQMKRAQDEAAWCKINTSYYGTYCYSTAIMRVCTRRDK
jgi:hypothetical protein